MGRIRPLKPEEARRSLANRLGRLDRLWQINTRLGVRPYRCFLVWTKWSGATGGGRPERGQGSEEPVAELELLPTPKVDTMDQVTFSPFHAGSLPVGSVRLSEVSARLYTYDLLVGRVVPAPGSFDHDSGCFKELHRWDHVPVPFDFRYELREDGRGDLPPERWRFQVLSYPFRRPGFIDWTYVLERASGDRDRSGANQLGPGGTGVGT